jgi:hypothetical protein
MIEFIHDGDLLAVFASQRVSCNYLHVISVKESRGQIMNRIRKLAKMWIYMTLYGCMLGAVAGFLVGFAILMSDTSFSEILELIYLSAIFWGAFGGIYGGASGFVSGFVMTLVTALAFGEIRDIKRFKIVMGCITAVITSGVFLLGGLWGLGSGDEFAWTSAMVMSVVIATYASQIVARRYAHDMNIRKKKVEV